MFTGIVKDIGVIDYISNEEDSLTLSISTNLEDQDLDIGMSVACNGCCLTVIEKFKKSEKNIFVVNVSSVTLAHTTFENMKIGSLVNLEPALKLGDSVSGHHMTGHIDDTCKICGFEKQNQNFWKLSLIIPKKYKNWIVPKGSIGIAGVSLTIASIQTLSNEDLQIGIMIIPHTFHNTTLSLFTVGMNVEIEFDHTVKTIASVLEGMLPNYIWARHEGI